MAWMLYGVTGYTGKLLLDEAIQRGHRPLIAGRSEEKLKPLAEAYNVEYVAFGVDAAADRLRGLGVDLVLNAAGPYLYTGAPMMDACLHAGAHYLDITGEFPVLEAAFARDAAARERGTLILSGVGFDVVPSDCLARYVADKLPTATHLEIVVDVLGAGGLDSGASAGTLKSMIEMSPQGGRTRRNGTLVPVDFGAEARRFRMTDGQDVLTMAIPWGDIVTAYHSTGIPNITTYMRLPPFFIAYAQRFGFLLIQSGRSAVIRSTMKKLIDRFVPGPSEQRRRTARSYVYARATDASGNEAEAWLDTLEAYALTAKTGILAVERVLEGGYRGAQSPAQAFGADFILQLESTRRYDTL